MPSKTQKKGEDGIRVGQVEAIQSEEGDVLLRNCETLDCNNYYFTSCIMANKTTPPSE